MPASSRIMRMMLCMLAMRNKGLKGKCKETGVTGSERNASQRNCTGTGEKPRCRKMQGTTGTKRERDANKGGFKEMKGSEVEGSERTCQETVREDMQRK